MSAGWWLSRHSPSKTAHPFARPHKNLNRDTRLFLSIGLSLLVTLVSPVGAQVGANAVAASDTGLTPSSLPATISAAQLRVPEKARARLLAAERDFRKSNIPQALQEIERALQTEPRFAQAYSMRALIRLAEKDASGAAEDSEMAVALDPNDAQGFLALGASLNSLREFPRAEAALRRARGLIPDLWQAQLELAKSLYGQGQLALALQEVNAVNQDFPDVHLVRGNVLMRLRRREEAAAEFTLFTRQLPGDPRVPQIMRILAALPQLGQPGAR